jgi:predicted metalloprotease with PDZ domain
MWLLIDVKIRQLTEQANTLNDFGRSFFQWRDEGATTSTYVFEDVITTLNKIARYDWAALIKSRLDTCASEPPLEGITTGGYALVFKSTANAFQKSGEKLSGIADLSHSLGLSVTTKGELTEVIWDGPAFEAGLTVGAKILAVNGRRFSNRELEGAIERSGESRCVYLTVQKHKHTSELRIDYKDGHRFPWLVPKDQARILDDIIKVT